MVPINIVAVLICAVAGVVLGVLWYGPLFGKIWMKEAGIKMPEKITSEMKRSMYKGYVLQAVASFVMAYVLAHVLVFSSAYLDISGLAGGFQAAFWSWLGFIATALLPGTIWEGKSWKYYVVASGYYLVALLVMSAILVLWV